MGGMDEFFYRMEWGEMITRWEWGLAKMMTSEIPVLKLNK